jgi:hypothetical protein
LKTHVTLVAAPAALAFAFFAGSASAQTTASSPAPAAGSSGQPEVQATLRTEGGRRVYVSTSTIEVRGEIQRPYAFSLSGRSSLGYTYVDVPVHFIEEIINAVRRAPF